ncbi:hypothetical protein [Sabulicella rubraurantiaca]|uniref:hypothetical protein n=1 Tax=Sabulicella rubraurantiaca TaxID=2811429 RepID=UPI001A96BE64|nr:hypothetical protein [Sabulicella rubraurantiaca]
MPIDPKADTMLLWSREEPTDPKYTKPFTRSGGFRGTAINATYVRKRLTHAFGPVGLGWGVEVLADDVVPGAPVIDGSGRVLGQESVQRMRIRFWYHPAGCRQGEDGALVPVGPRAQSEQVGQTTYVSWRRGKNGEAGRFETDEEAWKKSLTDALTKAASEVGIGADVHLGRFDDVKYVEARNQDAEAEQVAAEGAARMGDLQEARDNATGLLERLEAVTDGEGYNSAMAAALKLRPSLLRLGLREEIDALRAAMEKAKRRVAKAAA